MDSASKPSSAVVFASLAGMTIAMVLRYALGSIDQNFSGVAGGLTLGALLAMLLGNPLSALNSAPELLPTGWGDFGQSLPQGANATLLRSTAYFGGVGADPARA